MQFREWFQEQLYLELFTPEEIDAFEPEDGRWDHEPIENSPHDVFTYRFNVRSDPKKDCGYTYSEKRPCYHVSIKKSGYIDFGHWQTGVDDRFKNRDGVSGSDTVDADKEVKIGKDVMYSVLKAIAEVVRKVHPDELYWMPISKQRSNALNSEAREKVYKLWATKALFPKHYVPLSSHKWIRRDIYDKDYVSLGLPALPEDVKSPKDKSNLIDEILRKLPSVRHEIDRREQEAEERRRTEEAQRLAANPRYNPHGIQMDDEIIIHNGRYRGAMGKVVGFYTNMGYLCARIHSDEAGNINKQVSDIVKATEEKRNQRSQEYEDFMQYHNPEDLKVGDRVIVKDRYNGDDFGKEGKVVRYDIRYAHEGEFRLVVQMDHDEYNEKNFSASSLLKATPHNKRIVQQLVQQYKQEIEDSQRRYADEQSHYYRVDSTTQERMRDPQHNPNGIKLRDEVTFQKDGKDHRGIVVGADYAWHDDGPSSGTWRGGRTVVFRVVFLDTHDEDWRPASTLQKARPVRRRPTENPMREQQMAKIQAAIAAARTNADPRERQLLRDPQANPKGLKLGDGVTYTYMSGMKIKGKIAGLSIVSSNRIVQQWKTLVHFIALDQDFEDITTDDKIDKNIRSGSAE